MPGTLFISFALNAYQALNVAFRNQLPVRYIIQICLENKQDFESPARKLIICWLIYFRNAENSN